jgi:hypothetical protein
VRNNKELRKKRHGMYAKREPSRQVCKRAHGAHDSPFEGGGDESEKTHVLQPVESVRECRSAACSCTPVWYAAPSPRHAQSSTAFTACGGGRHRQINPRITNPSHSPPLERPPVPSPAVRASAELPESATRGRSSPHRPRNCMARFEWSDPPEPAVEATTHYAVATRTYTPLAWYGLGECLKP